VLSMYVSGTQQRDQKPGFGLSRPGIAKMGEGREFAD
jgi:hypothetical protein